MTTPDSHIPNSNAYPGGGNWGVQSYVPAPQGVPQAGVPAQPIYQGVPTGYPNPGARPPRRSGMKISGIILLVFAAIILVLSVAVCVGIEFIPGDHGDSGDGLAWLGVMVLLYVVPFALMLAICGLYQLFGHGFTTAKGQEIPGISLMDAHTVAGDTRLIGQSF